MKKLVVCFAILLGGLSVGSAQFPTFNAPLTMLPDTLLTVYPNPVHDQLNVSYPNNGQQDLRWQVYDISGKLVENGIYPASAQTAQVEMGQYKTGLYILEIETPGGNDRKTTSFEKF